MESLATLVQREGPLDERDAVGWVIRLAKRVEELHRLGVAHGGVSAYCILVEGKPFRSRGVLGDVRQAATRPAYHCPERHAGQGISPVDDTWGLAVTLYYLLTGTLPFAGETAPEIRQRIHSVAAAPLAVFDVGDDALQRVLDQFLSTNPQTRRVRVAELREALERWHADPAIAHVPPLEDEEDDSFGDDEDDDDEEHVATVMRDFGEVRAQLEALQRQQQAQAAPRPPEPSPNTPRFGRPGVAPPPLAPPLGQRPRAPTAVGGFGLPQRPMPPAPSAPHGVPAPHSSPAMGAPGMGARVHTPFPPMSAPGAPPPPQSGTGVAPPRGSGPGLRFDDIPSPDFGIEDEDSDEHGATVMMDAGAHDYSEAIASALAAQGSPSPISESDPSLPRPPGSGAGGPAGAPPGWPERPPAMSGAGLLGAPPGHDAAQRGPAQLGPPLQAPPLPQPQPPPPQQPIAFGTNPPAQSGGFGAPQLSRPPLISVPEPPDRSQGRGLRIALIVASMVLVVVVVAVLLLWLDRQRVIDLGLGS